jgi:hypothetical protein
VPGERALPKTAWSAQLALTAVTSALQRQVAHVPMASTVGQARQKPTPLRTSVQRATSARLGLFLQQSVLLGSSQLETDSLPVKLAQNWRQRQRAHLGTSAQVAMIRSPVRWEHSTLPSELGQLPTALLALVVMPVLLLPRRLLKFLARLVTPVQVEPRLLGLLMPPLEVRCVRLGSTAALVLPPRHLVGLAGTARTMLWARLPDGVRPVITAL